MEKKHSISENDKQKIIETVSSVLNRQPPVLFSYVFGSFIEGAFQDIDVGVFIDESKATSFLGYELQMESLLNNEVGKFTFDVRVLNQAPLSFQYEVIKRGNLIMTKDEVKRVDFETSTFSHYFDFEPFRDRYLREVLSIGSKYE